MSCEVNIRIGGEAGQGMNIVSNLLAKTFTRKGFWVFVNHDLMSRIRGGHNFSQVRISPLPARTLSGNVDILACLDRKTLDLHKDKTKSFILYDSSLEGVKPVDARYCPVPMAEIAKSAGNNPKMANTVACGAILGLLGQGPEEMLEYFAEVFSGKGNDVVEANKNCVTAGYGYIKQNFPEKSACFSGLKPDKQQRRMLVTGAEAIALGAIRANLKFYSAYPMSPATTVLEYIAANQKDLGIVAEQAEDEIAAVNMAIGASYAGARAMTGSSGGGIALMVEGISLAGMTETPIVIYDGQRPAPATGLPTRTEQPDLLYIAHSGHGEFPRIILAPGTAEEGFYLAARAFYLAEKYQVPVFILGDQYFGDSSWTVESLDAGSVPAERQSMLSEEQLKKMPVYGYRRYEITESGISPRILPGTPGQVVYADSDEHNEEGHITESAQMRGKMVEKRLRKINGILDEIKPPKIYPGAAGKAGNDGKAAEKYIVCWGSTFAIVEEAVNMLRKKGLNIGYIHFSEVYPVRKEFIAGRIPAASELIGVENNATGQLSKLLRMETGIHIEKQILKYDGRPFTPQELVERIENVR